MSDDALEMVAKEGLESVALDARRFRVLVKHGEDWFLMRDGHRSPQSFCLCADDHSRYDALTALADALIERFEDE